MNPLFKKATGLKRLEIDGAAVWIRRLSSAELEKAMAEQAAGRGAMAQALVVAACLCDERGIQTDPDAAVLLDEMAACYLAKLSAEALVWSQGEPKPVS